MGYRKKRMHARATLTQKGGRTLAWPLLCSDWLVPMLDPLLKLLEIGTGYEHACAHGVCACSCVQICPEPGSETNRFSYIQTHRRQHKCTQVCTHTCRNLKHICMCTHGHT